MEDSLRLASERILEIWNSVFQRNPTYDTHNAFHKAGIDVAKDM